MSPRPRAAGDQYGVDLAEISTPEARDEVACRSRMMVLQTPRVRVGAVQPHLAEHTMINSEKIKRSTREKMPSAPLPAHSNKCREFRCRRGGPHEP